MPLPPSIRVSVTLRNDTKFAQSVAIAQREPWSCSPEGEHFGLNKLASFMYLKRNNVDPNLMNVQIDDAHTKYGRASTKLVRSMAKVDYTHYVLCQPYCVAYTDTSRTAVVSCVRGEVLSRGQVTGCLGWRQSGGGVLVG
jgi:hypothetical protein